MTQEKQTFCGITDRGQPFCATVVVNITVLVQNSHKLHLTVIWPQCAYKIHECVCLHTHTTAENISLHLIMWPGALCKKKSVKLFVAYSLDCPSWPLASAGGSNAYLKDLSQIQVAVDPRYLPLLGSDSYQNLYSSLQPRHYWKHVKSSF